MKTNNKFFVYDSYVFAFKNFLAHIRTFVIASLVWIAVFIPIIILTVVICKSLFASLPMAAMAGATWQETVLPYFASHKIMILLCVILMLLFFAWVGIGIARLSLRIYDEGKFSMQDLFPSPLLIIKAFLAMIGFFLIMLLGLIFFVIPGIYWIVRAYLFLFALVEGEGIFESFATSFRITRNKEWQILGQFLVNTVLSKVFIFFSFMGLLSNAYLYRYLQAENK